MSGIRETPQELSVVEAVARAIHSSPVFQPAHGPWRDDVMAAGQQHCMKAARAAIAAYRGSSIPLVADLDAEVLAELDIQLRKPSSVILPVEREGWKDISTAPKDGSEILITDGQWAGAGFYHDGTGCKRSDGGWFCEEDRNNLLIARDVPAKFWQPLPNPPASP